MVETLLTADQPDVRRGEGTRMYYLSERQRANRKSQSFFYVDILLGCHFSRTSVGEEVREYIISNSCRFLATSKLICNLEGRNQINFQTVNFRSFEVMSNKSTLFVAFLAAVLPFKAAAQGGFGGWGGWGGFAPCAVCIMYPVLCITTDTLCSGKVFMCE